MNVIGVAKSVLSGDLAGLARDVVKRAWPDASEEKQRQFELAFAQLAAEKEIELAQLSADKDVSVAQAQINQEEAKSGNPFNSGWRPFTGWVCGVSLGYAGVLEPFLRFTATVVFGYTGSFPVVDTSTLIPILLGMLGLATHRTMEKFKGVAR